MKRFLLIVFAISVIFIIGCDEGDYVYDSPAPVINGPSWYKEIVFYQIYPRSFKDTNSDGIGDLEGIIQKLDYLYDLGIGGIWLNPVYPTPNHDLGYDTTNHKAINPEFGTMEDFERLLNEAHSRNIKIFMDMVFNYTSSEHPWFIESRSSTYNEKRDWYVWSPEPAFECKDIITIGSPFGEERWKLDSATGEYYFHQFYDSMPDLNLENPDVRDELLSIARFWLDKGVDGFRLDAASFYYENCETDECRNQAKNHEFLRELRTIVDSYPNRAMVGEVLYTSDEVIPYLGNGSDELHMYFNFFPLSVALLASTWGGGGIPIHLAMEDSYMKFPDGGHHGITIGNHDLPRSYFLAGQSIERAKVEVSLQLTLPGTPFIYYGEEVGITTGSQIIVDYRDWARTPMQWDGSQYAGFSDVDPWIDLSWNHYDNNVADEMQDEGSLYHHYRKLIRMRNALPPLRSGDYHPVKLWGLNEIPICAFFRGNTDDWVLVVVNTCDQKKSFNIDFTKTPFAGQYGKMGDAWKRVMVTSLAWYNERNYPITVDPQTIAILKGE